MANKIAFLGKDNHVLGSHSKCIDWISNQSLFDYDVLVVDALAPMHDLINKYKQQNLHLIGNFFLKRVTEIYDFLKHGRVVIFLVRPYPELTKGMDGYDEAFDPNLYLFNSSVNPIVGKTTNIEPNLSGAVTTFLSQTIAYYRYEGVLENPEGTPLLRINGTQRVVASYLWTAKQKVFFLPTVSFSALDSSTQARLFLKAIDDLIVALNSTESADAYELPAGHVQYSLPEEITLQAKSVALEEEIADANQSLIETNVQLGVEQSYKHLFLSNGEALVAAASRALSDIGFEVQNGPVGRDDLICTYNGKRAVVEVKGRENKSAAEKDSAQLEKWAARELGESEIVAKPILIVNGYCSLPLADRADKVVFPHQMLAYAEKRDHCLCSGLDLFLLSHVARTNPEMKMEIAELFFTTIGVLKWDQIPKWEAVIQVRETDEST